MRELARRYLDTLGECLDLGPESTHEVMSELENHFIEEAAHSPLDPQDVAEQRVISRLGSPRRLAARLNRSPRELKRGDPIFISFPLAFGLFRRWRQAMAFIAGSALPVLLILTGLALVTLLRLPFYYWPFMSSLVMLSYAVRWLILWVFDHLTRDEVERVTTAVGCVAVAGYIVDGVILIRPLWDVDARLSVGVIVVVPLIAALLAFRLANAMRWRPKPWAGVDSSAKVIGSQDR
jgi:uncharacterized membrane protein